MVENNEWDALITAAIILPLVAIYNFTVNMATHNMLLWTWQHIICYYGPLGRSTFPGANN